MSIEGEVETKKSKKEAKKQLEEPSKREHHENTSKWVVNTFEAPKKLDEIDKEEHKDVVYHHEIKKTMVAHEEVEDESEEEPVVTKK